MTLRDLFETFPDDDATEQWFIANRRPNGIVCPMCGSENVKERASHPTMPLRRTTARSTFSVEHGTAMQVFQDRVLGLDHRHAHPYDRLEGHEQHEDIPRTLVSRRKRRGTSPTASASRMSAIQTCSRGRLSLTRRISAAVRNLSMREQEAARYPWHGGQDGSRRRPRSRDRPDQRGRGLRRDQARATYGSSLMLALLTEPRCSRMTTAATRACPNRRPSSTRLARTSATRRTSTVSSRSWR